MLKPTLDGVNDSVQLSNIFESFGKSLQLCSISFNIARNSYSTLFHETPSEIQNVAFIEDITNKIKRKANTRYFM